MKKRLNISRLSVTSFITGGRIKGGTGTYPQPTQVNNCDSLLGPSPCERSATACRGGC